jgi:GTP pyrophosphokinase
MGIFHDGKLAIHVKDCPAALRVLGDPERWVDVEWAQNEARLFDVTILIHCHGGHGMLERIDDTLGDEGCNIQRVVMEPAHFETPGTIFEITVQVKSPAHLDQIIRRVSRVPDVVSVTRARGMIAGKPSPARISPSPSQ